jgi:SOS-response transcriptional repressor LexA
LNFVPLQDFANRAKGRINAEPSGGQIDAIVFRVTDHVLPDAVISALGRNVTVRLITDAAEYRNVSRLWDAAHIDRMWVGTNGHGAQIRVGNHGGNVHGASIVLHSLGEVIFGSSNWTTPSANKQDEHNFFYTPNFNLPWFFQWFEDQFANKWNDLTNFPVFTPQPPTSPQYSAPVTGAGGQSTTSVTLKWEGGPWAHFYDVYFGTTSNPPLLVSNQQLGSPNPGTSEKYTVSNLLPGTTYYWRIVSKTWAQKINSGPIWSFTTSGSGGGGGGSGPFGGSPVAIPGTVQAENFDQGGQTIAYFDTTSGNSGGVYRSTDVDITSTTDSGGGYIVGWVKAGEWLNYTANISTTGTYQLQTRVANTGTGAAFRVEVDGVAKSGSIPVPNTGGYQAWQTITTPGLSLSSGQHVIRFVFTTNGSNGAVGNFNWFRLDSSSSTASITVQAENFDQGGQNIAYFDTTSGNSGGAYRSTDVDIASTTDSGGGYIVGWTKAGEWLNYTTDISTTGTYELQSRVANTGTGAAFRVEVDGVANSGSISVPNTGGYQAWQTITTPGLSLSSGQHVMRVVFATNGSNGAVGNFNWFRLAAQ